MASTSDIVSHQAWEKHRVNNRQPPGLSQCKQTITRPKLWATGRLQSLSTTISCKCKQNHQNDVSDVEMPPPTLPPSAHPPENISNNARRKQILFSHFPKDPNCEMCRRTEVTRAPCRRNLDDPADRIQIAERFGDKTTADHQILNED